MKIQVLFAIAFISVATVAEARSPFGRGREIRSYNGKSVQATHAKSAPSVRTLPNSLEEMTKRFGPSILVRRESSDKNLSKFLTQPK